MKNKLQQFIVKLLAATLAIIMAVPTNVFAMSQRNSNTYTAATSVMGIQPKDDAPETETSQETNLLKSAVSTEETTDYIIEKSANLSQTTGQVTYKIAVKTKDPSQELTENQTTTFGITENTDLKDLKVEKVQALDADGKEIDVKNTLNTPKAFNSTDNLRTLGITATKPQYGMVYYLSTQLTEEALKNLEEKSPQLALDITIASPNQDIFQTRYSLETTKIDTTEITIDNDGNLVNQTSDLIEKEDNLHLYKGEYKKEEKTLFQTTPAHLVWTDYINAKDDKEFTINFDLDENQDTENSQINIDYYEARDKGYVLNQSFSKTVDFTNSLNLTIPQGYIAKVSLTTAIKENTNAKEYTFNGVKVANPTYKEEKTEKTEEEQATDDADPLPDNSSKNDGETKPSTDSIADESEQDFSQNPKSDTSAIALNKEAYLENLRDEEKLTGNLERAANEIELALESYNKEETNWDEFKLAIQNIAKEQNLDQTQVEEILQALLAGLNEDKYKVANIDIKEATNLVEESTDQSEPTDATEKSVDELVKEKLNEEGITIEDFQNYMYELEDKYGLTDEDAARIYGDNAEAIQGLVEKARQEKTTGDVFAVNTSNPYYGKNFHLITEMKALAAPTWQIPAGYWFDVNLGPYLKLKDGQQIKPLTDPSNPNRTIATGSYDARAHKIRYTFPQSVSVTKNLPINEVLTYDVENIERDFGTNPSSIPVKITIKPKNNPLQVMDTINVPSNTNGEFGTLVQKPGSNPQDAFRKSYPHDINYFSHQYYNTDNGTINWDIEINTKEIKLDHLNYGNAALSLYVPKYQGLDNYSITIKNKPTDFQNRQGLNLDVPSGNEKTFQTTNTWNKETSNEIQIASRSFTKEELPEVLYVHVESKLANNQPRNAWYDLGIRLTPDNNYISDLLYQFNGEWEKLQAAMPLVIPWKSGDEAAKRFEDGFNVIDTRLPANINGIADSQFDRKVYADKSRSVYASYDNPTSETDKDITWHISETIRIQDDQSTIGDDIFNASFENNTKKHTNPDIEILEPKSDGSYNRIYQTNFPNNPSNASSLRNWINSNRPDGLIPGTIINYVYHTTADNVNQDAIISIDFNDRFDDGAGTYGGNQIASIKRYPKNIDGTDTNRYKIINIDRISGKPSGDYDRLEGMIVENYGDIVYCINATLQSPSSPNIAHMVDHDEKYEDISGEKLNSLISRKTNDTDKLLRRLKAIFYTAEYTYKFSEANLPGYTWGPERVKFEVVQASIYKAIDEMNNGVGLNTSELLTYYGYFGSTSADNFYKRAIDPKVTDFYNKVLQEEKRLGDQIDNYVRLDGYKTHMNPKYERTGQNVLGPVFTEPVKFKKTDTKGQPISGIKFEIYDEKNIMVDNWVTDDKPHEVMLKPGKYTLIESYSENYKKLKPISFTIDEYRKPVQKYDTKDFSSGKEVSGQEVNYKYQQYFKDYSKENGELIKFENSNDTTTLVATNIKDKGKVKINKTFKDEDGNTSPLPGIEFELKKQGLFANETKTAQTKLVRDDKNGLRAIAEFTDLEPGTTWTLSEKSKSGLEPINVTWTVTVSNDNKVSIQANNDTNKISSIDDENGQITINITNKPETPVYGNFKIIKVSSDDDNQKLPGATFKLSGNGITPIEITTKDPSGEAVFEKLKPGSYTLVETKAPNDYQVDPDNDTWTVTVDKETGDVTIIDESGKSLSGNNLEYKIKNKKVPSYEFKLKKVSEDNPDIVIKGAKFTLTGPDPSTDSITRETDANGVISFEDLNPGSYQLIEKNPAPGYYKSDKTWTVTITNDGEAYYRENPSSNVAFNTIDENEERSDSGLSVDKNYGTFNLASIINVFRIPEAYAASSGWEKVESGRSNPVTQSSNEVKTKITEVNKSTKQFKQIFLIDGNKNNQNNDFNLNIKRVPNGSLDQNQVSVRVFTVDSSSTVDNLINPGNNLNLQGVTNDNNYSGEVKIRFNATGNRGFSKANIFAIEVTTSYNQGSPLGLKMDYFHTRSGAPSNWKSYTGSQYYTSENEINKAVKGEERGYEESVIPVDNSTEYDPNLDKGKVRIVEGNEGIKRTYYIYETENGRRTGVKRIDTSKGTNGVEIIKQMTPTIKYIGTKPLGPEQSTSTFTRDITINYETETRQDPDLKMGEKEVIQKGQMGTGTNKYSITYEKSSGADVPKIKDWPSDIDIEKNRPGNDWRVVEYKVIEETRTPPTNEIVKVGTKYVEQSGDISVRDNNGYAVITNKPIEFKIIKSNSSGEKLPGAEFTLYTDSSATQEISIKDVPATVKTDNDGIATFKALPANTYYLKETKAPNSYVPLSKVWKMDVSEDGVTIDEENVEGKYSIVPQTDTDSATLKVINNQPTYPSTGGSGTFIGFALIGTAVMLAGIAYYGIYVNDKNRRRSNRYGK